MRRLLHRLASTRAGYDVFQILGGEWITRPFWKRQFAVCRGTVLDIGGGTGAVGRLLPPGVRHYCLDNDFAKLAGRERKGEVVVGDALNIPLRPESVDFVTCLAVTHHLSDDELERALRECVRVLRPGGTLLLCDALWKPFRLPSRLLWSLDRGAAPRTERHLDGLVRRYFDVETIARAVLYHEYVAFRCSPRRVASPSSDGSPSKNFL